MNMSLAQNNTAALWRAFMPVRRELPAVGSELYSLSFYPDGYFSAFDPHREFQKWAAVAVPDTAPIPDNFETTIIPEGLYAVFLYRGRSQDAGPFFQSIFGQWLPASGYVLAHRPHFEILGLNYRPDDPEAEETVWIPVEKLR
jgi:AraC family transcriptional regulator